jgi:hypothetical protein
MRKTIMGLLLQNRQLTLAEVNKLHGYVDTGDILSDLAQRNSFLDEAPWFPSTHGSHNETFRAKSLGKGAFTRANTGIPQLSSTGDILKEPVRVYEGESSVDDRLLEGADDPYMVRQNYDVMNLEGIMQDFNHALVYANATSDADSFEGFVRRRASIGKYVRDGGGTGTGLTSAWLFEFGRRGVFLTYNKAGSPGLENRDEGRQRVDAPDGTGKMYAWLRHYKIWAGINIANDRALQRYANIVADDTSSSFDPKMLIRMKAQLPTVTGANAVLFVNRSLFSQIEQAAWDKSNMSYTIANFEGFGPVVRVASVIVRPWEAISENETAIA